jgi:uncharacterized protein YcnI
MSRGRRPRRTLRVLALAAVGPALAAAPASAHLQVRPAHAAPGDPVLWTVLVPSEDESGTRQVALAVPRGVLPFSYEHTPGWTRRLRTDADGSVRAIVWRGRTSAEGLATFRFLASTPERAGPIAWKAIQTYRDGAIVRWIGSAGSEYPASVTAVSPSVPRENAGGEGGAGASGAGGGAVNGAAGQADAARTDWVARALALATLLALAATALPKRTALRGTPRGTPAPSDPNRARNP